MGFMAIGGTVVTEFEDIPHEMLYHLAKTFHFLLRQLHFYNSDTKINNFEEF